MEVWKDIQNYENLYQVSNLGNVRSIRNGKVANKTLKKHKHGYLHVELFKNGKSKMFLVHRLVAIAFIENPHNYKTINHKDECRTNNNVLNLEWCTQSYNMKYSYEKHKGEFKAYKRDVPIKQLSINGDFVKIWKNTIEIKQKENKHPSSIWDCCLGKRQTAYGYKWAFCS